MATRAFHEAVNGFEADYCANPLCKARVNVFVTHRSELQTALGWQTQLRRRFGQGPGGITKFRRGNETLDTEFESYVHYDKQIMARGRLFLYRHHHLDNNLIDQVFADEATCVQYRYDKRRLCRLQTACQREALGFALLVVERSVHRGGGMQRWQASTGSQRRRFWKDDYEPIKFWVDRQMFYTMSHGVNLDAIHGIDNAETAQYRKKNEIVVLELLEATWTWVVESSPRVDYGVREIWRSMPNNPAIVALGLPEDAMLVPAVPGGVEGMVRRKEAIRPMENMQDQGSEVFPKFG
ncbi:hypothetical protein KC336_g5750 [Hortaea werneckii]|nr:hypothetical protein KC336_g5750 [Hortaea werneckii]